MLKKHNSKASPGLLKSELINTKIKLIHLTSTLIELRFYIQPDTKQVISETFFPANLLA